MIFRWSDILPIVFRGYKHFWLWHIFDGAILLLLDIINCGVDDECHENATCTDANGNYTCDCKTGFTGDGFNCTGNSFTFPQI